MHLDGLLYCLFFLEPAQNFQHLLHILVPIKLILRMKFVKCRNQTYLPHHSFIVLIFTLFVLSIFIFIILNAFTLEEHLETLQHCPLAYLRKAGVLGFLLPSPS